MSHGPQGGLLLGLIPSGQTLMLSLVALIEAWYQKQGGEAQLSRPPFFSPSLCHTLASGAPCKLFLHPTGSPTPCPARPAAGSSSTLPSPPQSHRCPPFSIRAPVSGDTVRAVTGCCPAGAVSGQICEPERGSHHRTSTLLLGTAVAAGETGRSDGLAPGAGPTGLDRWLGFCSDNPAAFFLWAAIWDKTLSMLPPEGTETGVTTTACALLAPAGISRGWKAAAAAATMLQRHGGRAGALCLPGLRVACSWIGPQWPSSLFLFHQIYPGRAPRGGGSCCCPQSPRLGPAGLQRQLQRQDPTHPAARGAPALRKSPETGRAEA